MKDTFCGVLIRHGFTPEKAEKCALVFAGNSLEGVYSHGVNRFPRFIRYILKGYIRADAEPTLVHRAGAIEQWDGNFGPGPLNAILATDRVTEISAENGIGLIGMKERIRSLGGELQVTSAPGDKPIDALGRPLGTEKSWYRT